MGTKTAPAGHWNSAVAAKLSGSTCQVFSCMHDINVLLQLSLALTPGLHRQSAVARMSSDEHPVDMESSPHTWSLPIPVTQLPSMRNKFTCSTSSSDSVFDLKTMTPWNVIPASNPTSPSITRLFITSGSLYTKEMKEALPSVDKTVWIVTCGIQKGMYVEPFTSCLEKQDFHVSIDL